MDGALGNTVVKYMCYYWRNKMEVIKFYKVKDDFGFLSNFAPYGILLECFFWKTVEHYFQAAKFSDYKIQDIIRDKKTAISAAQEGRKREYPIREDWDDIRDDKMRKALSAKFLQHHELKRKLLKTGDAILIEHTKNDHYWADGGDGTGLNKLGTFLMELRNDIREIDSNPDTYFPPWIAFADIDPVDMFWRMGSGESFLDVWNLHFSLLSNVEQAKYIEKFQEPDEWKGFYSE